MVIEMNKTGNLWTGEGSLKQPFCPVKNLEEKLARQSKEDAILAVSKNNFPALKRTFRTNWVERDNPIYRLNGRLFKIDGTNGSYEREVSVYGRTAEAFFGKEVYDFGTVEFTLTEIIEDNSSPLVYSPPARKGDEFYLWLMDEQTGGFTANEPDPEFRERLAEALLQIYSKPKEM